MLPDILAPVGTWIFLHGKETLSSWWRLMVSSGCDMSACDVDICLLITRLRPIPYSLSGIHQSPMTFCLY